MNTAEQLDTYFTYANYCQWPADERWELINGEAYMMAAPNRLHQKIVFELGRQIGNHFLNKTCEGYVAPFDVRLPNQVDAMDDQIDTVVQPDLAVICDESKLDDKGCLGAPDWVIEVLSPATARKDMDEKRDLYQKHGVREYWLVHPTEAWVMVYRLNEVGEYSYPQVLGFDGLTPVGIFPDLSIDWSFMPQQVTKIIKKP